MNEHTRNDLLAAEYVLGTLRGAARRRFENLLHGDPALEAQVCRWQEALAVLDQADTPVQPPGRVWRTIQLRLPQSSNADRDLDDALAGQSPLAPLSRPQRLTANVKTRAARYKWQLVSFALAASLVAVMLWPHFQIQNGNSTELLPVAVLASTQGQDGRQIVVSFDARNRKLVLTPLDLTPTGSGHSLELWLIAKDRKPASLGLIEVHGNTVVALSKTQLSSEATLAVSLEPAGGSPTDQPTGAVLYAGKVGKI